MANQTNTTKKTLYFEGAGCVPCGEVENCRIRTAFHLDNGTPVYLELSCFNAGGTAYMWSCHMIDGECEGQRNRIAAAYGRQFAYTKAEILRFVNSLGCSFDEVQVLHNLAGFRVFKEKHSYGVDGYNFGDEFQPDADLIAARQRVDSHIREKEIARGERSICYSLWVDETDPAMLHYKNHRTGENFDIFLAVPKDPEQLPGLEKANAIPGCCYGFAGGVIWLHEIYRISEEYAKENELVYLDRVKTSHADYAVPGSDVAAWARGC